MCLLAVGMSAGTILSNWSMKCVAFHYDVIKWKHFPRYWPFVRGIHRSPLNSPHKGQWRGTLMFFFNLRLDKWLSKQPRRHWLETPSRSLWRHCNVIVWIRIYRASPFIPRWYWYHSATGQTMMQRNQTYLTVIIGFIFSLSNYKVIRAR